METRPFLYAHEVQALEREEARTRAAGTQATLVDPAAFKAPARFENPIKNELKALRRDLRRIENDPTWGKSEKHRIKEMKRLERDIDKLSKTALL